MVDAGLPDFSTITFAIIVSTNFPDNSYTEIKGGRLRVESGVTARIGQNSTMRISK